MCDFDIYVPIAYVRNDCISSLCAIRYNFKFCFFFSVGDRFLPQTRDFCTAWESLSFCRYQFSNAANTHRQMQQCSLASNDQPFVLLPASNHAVTSECVIDTFICRTRHPNKLHHFWIDDSKPSIDFETRSFQWVVWHCIQSHRKLRSNSLIWRLQLSRYF